MKVYLDVSLPSTLSSTTMHLSYIQVASKLQPQPQSQPQPQPQLNLSLAQLQPQLVSISDRMKKLPLIMQQI